jgi:hypothetical protein
LDPGQCAVEEWGVVLVTVLEDDGFEEGPYFLPQRSCEEDHSSLHAWI